MKQDINNIDPGLLDEDNRIVAYLKGQMTIEEEIRFLKELDENPNLKEKAIVTARLVKGLKQVGSEQDKNIIGAFLASSEQEVVNIANKTIQLSSEQAADNYDVRDINNGLEDIAASRVHTSKPKAKIIKFRKAYTWLSVAASTVIIVWLGIGYNNYRKITGLGEEYGNVINTGIIIRGADNPTEADKKLERLFSDVINGNNLDEAIHELYLCWELSTMETYNDYTDYSAEIGWNLAIAYLKDNDKNSAKNILELLIEKVEKESAISYKAKELLEQL